MQFGLILVLKGLETSIKQVVEILLKAFPCKVLVLNNHKQNYDTFHLVQY